MGRPTKISTKETFQRKNGCKRSFLPCLRLCLCDNKPSLCQGDGPTNDGPTNDRPTNNATLRMHQPLHWDRTRQGIQGRPGHPVWTQGAWGCYVDCNADCRDNEPTASASRCKSTLACDVFNGIEWE